MSFLGKNGNNDASNLAPCESFSLHGHHGNTSDEEQKQSASPLAQETTVQLEEIDRNDDTRNEPSGANQRLTGDVGENESMEEDHNGKGHDQSDTKSFSTCKKCQAVFTTKYNPLPPSPSRCQRLKYTFLCPPHSYLSLFITWLTIIVLLWGVLFSILRDDALPGGNIFALYILVVSSMVAGLLVERLIRLPALLGMLVMGFLLRNVPCIAIATDIHSSWSTVLRSMSLVVILLKAGLGINTSALRRLGGVCLRLSFIPCLCEACAIAVVSYFLLNFPWDWAFMLGFVLAALSPAVVVPSLLHLQDLGWGSAKGVPTLGVAACSLDNVLAISAFGIIIGISFSSGNLVFNIIRGPIEVILGLTFGLSSGVLLWYFPSKDQESVGSKRTVLLLCGGLFAVFGSQVANFPGAGALGCIAVAVVAAYKWGDSKAEVRSVIDALWVIFEPILYGLIGAEVSIAYLDASTVGLGIATIVIGLVIRMFAAMFATSCSSLNGKERLFTALAWLPKATVQAALGPVALDTVKNQGGSKQLEQYATQLLTIAVLSILITAPLGAVLISIGGKRLLERSLPDHVTGPGKAEEPAQTAL